MRLLHTSITVKNMDESIGFYTNVMGMKLRARREIKENDAEIAFLDIDGTNHEIELTWWRKKTNYTEGDQLDHMAFEVEDLSRSLEKMRGMKVEVAKEPYSLGSGRSRIAFIKDPNGIWLELIEKKAA
jgi:lactoylglutathione lyase